ncbi:MAG: fibronectin type III domain-containing protein, partial [Gaiellaceae bacterium]
MHRRKPKFLLLVLIGLLTVCATAGQAAGGARDDGSELSAQLKAELRKAVVAQERASDGLIDVIRIVGTGVGLDAAGKPVVKVLTARPNVTGVPKRIDGVRTEVVVTGHFVAQHPNCPQGPQTFCTRPVPSGVSSGHPDISAGTLGTRVSDAAGNVYALSNNHVYANENQALLGDPILQPGSVDGGSAQNPDHLLGTLANFEPIEFCDVIIIFPMCDDSVTNSIDAAIALVAPDDLLLETDCGFTPTADTVPVAALVPNVTQVKKCGRTTGLTTGTITAVNVQVDVGYLTGFARFQNQIMTTDISDGGDSGSLIVNTDNQPVALLFAGSDTNSIGSPIDDVLDAFDVTIDDGSGGGDPTDTTPPAAPTGLAAIAGDGAVTLDWDDNSEPDLSGYRVYRSESPGGPYTLISPVLADSNHVDPAATNGITHYYVVRARDLSANESADSNEAQATPVNLAPTTPKGFAAVAGDGQVALSWDLGVEPDLDRYRLYRAGTSGGPFTLIA